MNNVSGLPSYQQAQFQQYVVNHQVKESLQMYMDLAERCFEPCVHNFRTKYLDKHETKCLESCTERYIKAMNRGALRFQEHQALQMKKMQELQQSGGGMK